MKMPLGTEVDRGPGHIVLDGDPAPRPCERGTAASSFRPMSIVATIAGSVAAKYRNRQDGSII